MSLALRWGDDDKDEGGFIYLNATTLYTQSYTGQVTKHPIDSGGEITDHFINNNPTFNVSGVITGDDINTSSYLIQDLVGNAPFNVNEPPTAVNVGSTDLGVLSNFIPTSIGQFLPSVDPEVTMDAQRADLLEQIRNALTNLVSGFRINEQTGQFEKVIQIVRLFEYDGINLKRIINNLVITSINFKEDVNTGYALYPDFTFEQVSFAGIKKTTIPKDVVDSLKKKAATKESKGKQDSTVNSGNNPPKTDDDEIREVAKEL
jgi:hypothetical protein